MKGAFFFSIFEIFTNLMVLMMHSSLIGCASRISASVGQTLVGLVAVLMLAVGLNNRTYFNDPLEFFKRPLSKLFK